jgi:hypothetical protein
MPSSNFWRKSLDVAVPPPGAHRAPQLVGFARGEAGGHHRQLHHLLLKNRHAQRLGQHFGGSLRSGTSPARRRPAAAGTGCTI